MVIEEIGQFWNALQGGQLPALGYLSYILLSFFVAIEGPIASLLGAAAASTGYLRLPLVFIAAASGNLFADILWYGVGYRGKLEWVIRFGKRVGIDPGQVERMKTAVETHAPRVLLIAKLTNAMMIPALIAAGLVRVPWRRWFPGLLLGETIWTGSLVLLGYFATESILNIQSGIRWLGFIATGLLLLVAVVLARRALQRKPAVLEISDPAEDRDPLP